MMKKKKIFTPIIAVGLAMSLSVGSEVDTRDLRPDAIIDLHYTQIDNLVFGSIPNTTNSPHIYYTPQNKPIESFRLIFDSNTPPPSYDHCTLTYDSSNPQNATLNLGNSYWVDFDDTAGAWVNGFVVDLARNDYSSSNKWVEVSFGSFSGFSDGPIQKKSTFSILNSQSQEDRVAVEFSGAVLSDFIINSQSRNSFTFRGSSSDEVNGNINISDSNSINTFDFVDVTYRGTFTNAISTDTQINLDGSNTEFIGDINTTAGATTINFLTSGVRVQGNITANGGSNIFNLSTYSPIFRVENIIATNSGNNTFNLTEGLFDFCYSTNGGATLTPTIFSGDSTGKNILNIGANISTEWGEELPLVIQSGNMEINIGDSSEFILNRDVPIKTQGGNTTINFLGSSGKIRGWSNTEIIANGGNNTITFKKDGTFDIRAKLQADNGSNHFVIDHNIILQGYFDFYSSEQSTNKNVFDIYANSSLLLQNTRLNLQSGNMEINFKGSGGKGIFNAYFYYTSKGSTITINTESQTHGVLLNTELDYVSNSKIKLNLQESSTLEVIDDCIPFNTINALGSQANLILTSNYGGSQVSVSDAISGENLIVTFDKGADYNGMGSNTLSLGAEGNELKALKIIKTVGQYEYDRLYLRQGSTSILEEVEILENKGIDFVLYSNSTSLTLKNNLVNSGGVHFTFRNNGGVVNSDIQSNETGITTFVFNQTGGTYSINGALSTSGEGKNIFDLTSKSATISNDLIFSGSNVLGEGGNIINIGANQTLALQNSVGGVSTIRSIATNGGITHLNLNGDNSTLSGNISTSSGNTIIDFSGNSQLSGTLEISDIGNTEIIVKSGKTGVISKSITANGETLNINLGDDSTLTLNGNLSTTKGETTISFIGSSGAISGTFITGAGASTAFELGASDSQSVVATITGTFSNANGTGGTNSNYNGGENFFAINAKDTTLINDSNGLVFMSGSNTISFENTSGATLHWRGTSGDTEQNITTIGGNTEIKFNNSGTIAGGIDTSGGNTTLYLGGRESGSKIEGIINGAITSSGRGANNVEFDNSNNTLILKDNATFSQVSNLSDGNNNGISFCHTSRSSTDFKTLTIGLKGSTTSGISGNGLNFLVYAISNTPEASLETQSNARGTQDNTPKAYADKIVIHSSSNKEATTHTLGVVFENQDTLNLDAISYTKGADNNILIASVSDSSKVSFDTQSTLVLGFDVARIDYVTESTDENGNISGSGYTSYFVGKAKAKEVVVAEQEITATAFTLNYDLYMANLNSLNKRMGELRENAHSQGVWARVFNGALSNDFGLGSKSNYTTIQAGYDYAFGFEGANNYLGVALSYALSTSTSQNAFDENGQRRGIDGIYSNAIEVALYNSYVSDRGWYNDSIAKFSYIMSKFDINNLNNNTSTSNDASNFALTLSDEVGYVFKLGEAKEWSITPQIEATFGYFSQSDFKQALANSNVYLDSMAENVLTLRARVGSAFAYDFKNFTQKDSFNASLYIGAFYEYDYVSGGEIKMNTQRETQTNKYSNLSSDGRVVMNVGTNMSIQNHTRLYFDFEKSFGGKINTDYQVNFGVRYSFGESNGYTPVIEKTESKAPLKVEEESKEEQESKEKITDKTQEDNKAKEANEGEKETENKEDSNPQE